MARKSPQRLLIVDGPEDIPDFPDGRAEAVFWGTHRLSNRLLAEMRPPTEEEAPLARRSRPISLRVSEDFLTRIQALAQRDNRPYQALLKEYVMERIEQEERQAQGQHTNPPTSSIPVFTEAGLTSSGEEPTPDSPQGQLSSVWVDVILAASPDPTHPIMIQGRLPVHPQFLTLNRRLTVEEAIEFLEYLRDLKDAPKVAPTP